MIEMGLMPKPIVHRIVCEPRTTQNLPYIQVAFSTFATAAIGQFILPDDASTDPAPARSVIPSVLAPKPRTTSPPVGALKN
jgi:hypothetical protein